MKLINNNFNDIEKIDGFTQDELIEIKRTLTTLEENKSDPTEIEEFLRSKFSIDVVDFYLDFIRLHYPNIDKKRLRYPKQLLEISKKR